MLVTWLLLAINYAGRGSFPPVPTIQTKKRSQILSSIPGVIITTNIIRTTATPRAISPIMVKGMRRSRNAGGKWPVMTPEGMKAWAINIQNAKMIIRGKKIQNNVNQLWILIQSTLVNILGSVRGIILSPPPAFLLKTLAQFEPSENYHNASGVSRAIESQSQVFRQSNHESLPSEFSAEFSAMLKCRKITSCVNFRR